MWQFRRPSPAPPPPLPPPLFLPLSLSLSFLFSVSLCLALSLFLPLFPCPCLSLSLSHYRKTGTKRYIIYSKCILGGIGLFLMRQSCGDIVALCCIVLQCIAVCCRSLSENEMQIVDETVTQERFRDFGRETHKKVRCGVSFPLAPPFFLSPPFIHDTWATPGESWRRGSQDGAMRHFFSPFVFRFLSFMTQGRFWENLWGKHHRKVLWGVSCPPPLPLFFRFIYDTEEITGESGRRGPQDGAMQRFWSIVRIASTIDEKSGCVRYVGCQNIRAVYCGGMYRDFWHPTHAELVLNRHPVTDPVSQVCRASEYVCGIMC